MNQHLSVSEIAELTGLPLVSIQEIVALLGEEGLAAGETITQSGERLLAGVATSKLLNDSGVLDCLQARHLQSSKFIPLTLWLKRTLDICPPQYSATNNRAVSCD